MSASSSACLEDDAMLAFVDGTLAEGQLQDALAHLDGCSACQELAAELAREHAAAPTPSELDAGDLVSDRFVLGKALGKGATGTVFRAHDRTLGVDVALKLIRKDASRDAGAAFRREVEIGRKVTHPNVCRLHDAGSTAHYDYITMELVDGDTLSHVIARDGVSSERALVLLGEIAAGLGAAHALGIVHRDLKPANVMIERATGRVVLTDFGFATDLDAKQSRRLVGTPAYWAPEQARGEPATPACDVYAFGVLAYRLFTDREFSLSDARALEAVPRRFRRVVGRCVEPRPNARYADARQAGAALAAAARRRFPATSALLLGAGACAVAFALRARGEPAAARPSPPAPVSVAAEIPSAPAPPALVEVAAPSASPPAPPVEAPRRPTARPVVSARPPVASSSAVTPPPAPPAEGADLLYRK